MLGGDSSDGGGGAAARRQPLTANGSANQGIINFILSYRILFITLSKHQSVSEFVCVFVCSITFPILMR